MIKSNEKTVSVDALDTERAIVTDLNKGLAEDVVSLSRSVRGKNKMPKNKRKSFLAKFAENLGDPIIRILIGALIINVLFMMKNINWPETIGIACAILVAALVSTISEYGSENAFEKLNERSGKGYVTVIRSGTRREINSEDIVSGDLILVAAGMSIPADCVVVSGSVGVNQAPLTGEAAELKKTSGVLYGESFDVAADGDAAPESSKIYKGCLCTKGECKAVVINVGERTEYGKIAHSLVREDRKSPLKERLSELAKTVSYLGYFAAFMIMAAYLVNSIVIDSGWNASVILLRIKDVRYIVSEILNAVTLGVSVIVMAVPEGLPMMITVVLSSNMKKMLRSGVLVRKMVGIETAGCMNVLFTDKTGTVTTGNMSVRKIITSSGEFIKSSDLSNHAVYREFVPLISDYLIGNTYRTATEKALVNFCKGTDSKCRTAVCKKLKFNSQNKYSACVYETSGIKKCAALGAAEKLLSSCKYYLAENGKVNVLNQSMKSRIFAAIKEETTDCARVMALTTSDLSCWDDICESRSTEYVFCALISIRDEIRHDIVSSVREATDAGVHVVMVTGDNRDTAEAIAREAGIINEKYTRSISGEELRSIDDEELKSILPKLAVVSRAMPQDKLRLVDISGKLGLVSGMTGDGINDAPSLKAADVGFAMGSGSDVAKEASDIILTNNSFSSITKAILYGRCVFESIRKFITFQLTMNLCALGVSLIGPFIGVESPITVIQMLWVNIIMDTLGGLAFAGEIPLKEYVKRPPMKRNAKILTGKMTCQILCCGLYTLALCIAFLKLPVFRRIISTESDTYFLTCFFALFIFCGLFNSFNARAPVGKLFSHISGNKAFIFIIAFVSVAQLTIIYFGGEIFRCTPVSLRDLGICFIISATVIPVDQIRKKIAA